MSSNKDDITRIEDLPDLSELELDDDFMSLDDLASDMGIHQQEQDENQEESGILLGDIENQTSDELDIPSIPEDDNFVKETPDSEADENNFLAVDQNEENALGDEYESEFNSDFDNQFENELESDFENELDSGIDSGFDNEFNNEFEEETNDDNTNLEFSEKIDEPNEDNLIQEKQPIPDDENQDPQPSSQLLALEELTTNTQLDDVNRTIKTPITQDTDINSKQEIPDQAHERFEDIKSFSEKITYGNFSSEGNPPFSVIIKDIKYHEDVEEICAILLELKIIDTNPTSLESSKMSLTRGQMLVPRLSEYAAIILCHKLRKFDIELLMGLTEELHPPKSYSSNDRGLSSKRTVYNNRKSDFSFTKDETHTDIRTTTLDNFTDQQIVEYLGIITAVKQITGEELARNNHIEEEIINKFTQQEQKNINHLRISHENKTASRSKLVDTIFGHQQTKEENEIILDKVYSKLIEELKAQASEKNANAIVGINFSITPISIDTYLSHGPKYQIICTGNMVWIENK